MKIFFNSKVITSVLIVNALVILTLIAGNYILSYLDKDSGGGADIGGGLLMLLSPILTCFLFGVFRGRKNLSYNVETWLLSFFITNIIIIICMVISIFCIDGREIFLVSTVTFPFDSFILMFYYSAGIIGEKISGKVS